ncbi:peroxiredoxin [Comamonas serinivorans]|uniref:Peroxiredoxin n=1 Tax=Comamonas serinivorans TaxID=1082851 RepID=A0A1Y0EL23_9BURK|nr:OsmC family protein [Comamonas serinivorans]ARU04287.1 peroxiredoxin [Comamonas serinivorans]
MPLSATAHSTATAYRVRLQDPAGHEWWADEPVSNGGGDTAPDPVQLVLSGLCACTTITVQMYAQRKGWPLSGVRVHATLNPAGDPPRGEANHIARELHLEGALDAEQRERLLQIANACPVHKLLSGSLVVDTTVHA